MRRLTGLILAVALAAATPRPAAAWGFDGHKYIMRPAIPLLPAEIRPFFLANRDVDRRARDRSGSVAHRRMGRRNRRGISSTWTRTARTRSRDLPHVEADAVAKYGREFVDKNGTLPWRAEEIYGKLVEAFTQKARLLAREHQVLLVGDRATTSPTRTCRSTPRSTTTAS